MSFRCPFFCYPYPVQCYALIWAGSVASALLAPVRFCNSCVVLLVPKYRKKNRVLREECSRVAVPFFGRLVLQHFAGTEAKGWF